MPQKIKKNTPSNCKRVRCKYNSLPPAEDSQECIGCEGNKNKDYMPKPWK